MPRLLRAFSVAALCGLLLSGCFEADRRLVEGVIEESEAPSFYEAPDPLEPGPPGELVRSEPIASTMTGSVAWRVLYHSRDLNGVDILVSGVVVAPAGTAPAGGRPVVSWAHPTTGSAPRCAPSVGADPFDFIEGLRALLDAGYVVAATDYPGMGAAGPDSYLVGTNEGNSVLDAARAARAIDEAGANDDLLLWGHSQGGQAALFAAQDAAAYAPELRLEAVAVAAPATDLAALLERVMADVSGITLSSYALQSYSTVYADRGATLESLLTPAGVAATPKMASLCLIGQNSAIHDIAGPLVGNYFSGDPATVDPWATLLAENSPGAVPLAVPLFVAQGDTDTLIDPATTRSFADHECAIGSEVTYLPIADTGHGLVALRAVDRVIAWFDDVRAGRPVDSHC
ncbi:alpha-beta hydrolase superfamily lysophospholipase [Conyzicola nivalis]|uniref:Alpha-beta hydrolase superfamily lysophospholipase n=1 Tax=Conyzicola nivalis TaxID=1477021 RepID=A0ABV2QP83_9MICO